MVQGRGQHRGDRAGAADRAHAIIQRVRHKDDVALGIPGDAVRGVELRGGRRTVIALEAERAGAGNRADHRGLSTDERRLGAVGIRERFRDRLAGHLLQPEIERRVDAQAAAEHP